MRRKKGFTLVEILIALALIGILVAVVSPNLARIRPDQKKALFVKAYTTTESAVASMINDTEMYPTVYDEEGNLKRFGLCSTEAPIGILAQTDSASGTNKFAHYFARTIGAANSGGTVEASNGIKYEIDFQGGGQTALDAIAAVIAVKTNIKSRGEDKEVEIGKITVRNGGTVECADDICTAYMDDRFDFKMDEDGTDNGNGGSAGGNGGSAGGNGGNTGGGNNNDDNAGDDNTGGGNNNDDNAGDDNTGGGNNNDDNAGDDNTGGGNNNNDDDNDDDIGDELQPGPDPEPCPEGSILSGGECVNPGPVPDPDGPNCLPGHIQVGDNCMIPGGTIGTGGNGGATDGNAFPESDNKSYADSLEEHKDHIEASDYVDQLGPKKNNDGLGFIDFN